MAFHQVSIIGVGLLGGSLGLALKRRHLAETVVGIGHRDATLRVAQERGAVDRWTLDMAEGVAGSDLVVLATPVGLFGRLIEQAKAALADGCIVTDVGSTKRAVLEAVLPHIPESCRFVGSHPLAGSEARSIDAATDDLYDGAMVLVCPTDRSDEEAVARIEQLWQAVGSRTRRIDPEVHDRLLAETSHVPHLVASALVEALGDASGDLVATGFLDTTRIASGDPAMWRDIFVTNRDEVLRAIERVEAVLAEARSALSAGDAEAIEALLRRAKRRRDDLAGGR
jgi:prephenate dehydrogenase